MHGYRKLIAGYKRFRTGAYERERALYDELSRGQQPPIMVVGCADSRVDPAILFDTGPGDVFVVRNVANLIPPVGQIHGQSSMAASLEFAVCVLKVEDLVILGHVGCGGIGAALTGATDDHGRHFDHIETWMDMIAPARNEVLAATKDTPDTETRRRALEQANVRLSVNNLLTYPFIQEAVESGALELNGMVINVADGSLRVMEKDGHFATIPVDL